MKNNDFEILWPQIVFFLHCPNLKLNTKKADQIVYCLNINKDFLRSDTQRKRINLS